MTNSLAVVKFNDEFVAVKREYGNKFEFSYCDDKSELEEFIKTGAVIIQTPEYSFNKLNLNLPYNLLYNNRNFITIDVMQEYNYNFNTYLLNKGYRLPSFDDKENIVEVIDELLYVLDIIEEIYEFRKDYFSSKIQLIKEYQLDITTLKQTRAVLSSNILQSSKTEAEDRLNLTININNATPVARKFYENIKEEFLSGKDYKELEQRKLNINLGGIEHTLGFGGIHGAIKQYKSIKKMLFIDFNSYYPFLMKIFNFFPRGIKDPNLFIDILNKRLELKKEKDKKESSYKIVLNSTYGAMKSKYNNLYDPLNANNIVVNGQLIITELIFKLIPFIKLIQTNTDGLILETNEEKKVNDILLYFEEKYSLKLDCETILGIVQKDVNNYFIIKEDGSIKTKGIYSKLPSVPEIVPLAIQKYYFENKKPIEVIRTELENKNFKLFQTIQNIQGEDDYFYINKQKINEKTIRCFAVEKGYEIMRKVNNLNSKVANTSLNSYVYNGAIDELKEIKIDIDYYLKLVEKYLF